MTIFEKAVDQIAPHLRDGALVVLRSTVYPGTTGVRRPAPRRRAAAASTSRSARSGSPRATRSRSSTRCPRSSAPTTTRAAERADGALRHARREDDPDDDQGGRARQALHEHVALHEVRRREPVLHDRRPGRAWTTRTSCTRSARTTRAPRTCPGPGFAAGPCLFKDTMQLAAFTTDHFPLGQAAMQVNEGLPAYIVSALERRYGGLRGKTVGHPRHGLQGRVGRHPRVAQLQAAQAPVVGRRDASCAPTRTSQDDRARPARVRPRARATSSSSARRTARTASLRRRRQGRRRHLGRPRRGDPALVRILVTGAAGFINGYLVPELLEAGHEVIGLDDFSKYGRLTKSYDDHPRYRFVEGDAKDAALMRELAADCDQVVAAAAMIGGISYFHEFAYDLLAENERILASTFDAAIAAHRDGHLERIIVVSARRWSTSRRRSSRRPRAPSCTSPPPISTYGFQKLASEYFAKGAWEQYELPYTIVRPFNCVGIGERRALRDTDIMSGNVKLALSHVVPDLVLKVLKGQDPLHILGDGDAGPPLHVRRRPGPRHPPRDGVARRRSTTTSTSRPRASTTVLELAECDLAQDPRRRPRRSATSPTRRSSTTSSSACPTSARRATVLGFEADDLARRRCSTRSSRGSATRSRPAGCDAAASSGAGALDRHARLQRGRGGRARPARPDRRRVRRRTRSSSSTTSTSDTTVPGRSRGWPPELPGAARPPQRPRPRRAQRDEGRDRRRRAAPYVLISMADGSDEPHVVDPMVALARGGADVVVGVALHARRPPGRRAAAQAADEPDRRADAPLVRRRADPRPDEQLQALLAPVPRLGRRSRARPASSSRSS